MNTTELGSISEGMVISALLKNGYSVSLPFGGGLRYDFIADNGKSLYRIQCKTARVRNGAVQFPTASVQRDTGVRTSYEGQVDLFGVYCPDNDKVYLVPVKDLPKNLGILRIDTPKNNQSKGVKWANEYEVV